MEIGYNKLRDSSYFFESISDEEFVILEDEIIHKDFKNNLSRLNLELQVLSKKVHQESESLTNKANIFLFFFKIFAFGGALINIIGGIIANVYPGSVFNKISAFLAAICSAILLIFNLKDQGKECKRVSNELKLMDQTIKKSLMAKTADEKNKVINEIKSKLIESDFIIYKINYGGGSG
jgi:hypothetical protein